MDSSYPVLNSVYNDVDREAHWTLFLSIQSRDYPPFPSSAISRFIKSLVKPLHSKLHIPASSFKLQQRYTRLHHTVSDLLEQISSLNPFRELRPTNRTVVVQMVWLRYTGCRQHRRNCRGDEGLGQETQGLQKR